MLGTGNVECTGMRIAKVLLGINNKQVRLAAGHLLTPVVLGIAVKHLDIIKLSIVIR